MAGPSDPTIKRLFAVSSNRCAFPGCNEPLVEGETVVGEVCHIKSARQGHPRHDASQSEAERHGFDNLVLLCRKHHKIVDTDVDNYPPALLTEMKKAREAHPTGSFTIPDDLVWRLGELLSAASHSGRGSATVHEATPNILTPANRPSEAMPDWRLHELFLYIDPNIFEKDTKFQIGNDLRDKLSTGQLKSWGRKLVGSRRMALAAVPQAFWADATFTYFPPDGDNPSIWDVRSTSQGDYADIQVNRAQAIACFPSATGNRLRIILGAGDHFEIRQSSGLYKTNHTFSVCIENIQATQFVSNCKLYLNIANPKDGGRKDYWLEGPFTLNPTEKKFRSLVSYLEPATISKHAGDFIQLHVPIGPGYGVGYGWPWRLPLGAYTFSLWATALETGRTDVTCKIWIDEDHKLHFDKA